MPVPLYCDQDSLAASVVRGLRARDVDVLTSHEAGRQRLPDADQLAFAVAQGRLLYSGNRRDFGRLHKQWMAAGRQHAGIVVRSYQRTTERQQIEALASICTALDPSTAANAFIYLESWLRDRPTA